MASGLDPGALCVALRAAGDVPATWDAELMRVRREDFVPAKIWLDEGAGYEPRDRNADQERWRQAVYSNRVIVTQFDDGDTEWPSVGARPSCSASMPSAVVGMLDALGVGDGQRALEIGTGTGFNAALLCERLGDSAVTTIEIDRDLAVAAECALNAAGYAPTVVCADGAAGWSSGGPYDRVIATAAVYLGEVPYSWVRQTVPGGVIVAPVRTALTSGPLVRFVVGDDGVARGFPAAIRVGFMELRDQRAALQDWAALRWDDPAAERSQTTTEPWSALLSDDSRWAIGVAVPSCRYDVWKRTKDRDHGVAWLADPVSGSWASVVPGSDKGGYDVRQYGPRRLWDEAETAYRWWEAKGRPTIDRWVFTVERDRQTVTLAE